MPVVAESPDQKRLRHASERLPRGFLGMIALLVLVELVFGFNSRRFANDFAWCWKDSARAAKTKALDADILCFGDSLVKFGVLPQVIEGATGRKTYNLALHGGPPAASYFLLRKCLEAGAHPSLVVVDFLPHQLERDPRHEEFQRAWPEFLTIRECADLARATGDPNFFTSTVLAMGLPSYRARVEIRGSLLARIHKRPWIASFMLRALERNWERNQGAQVLAEKSRLRDQPSWPDDAPLEKAWSVDKASLEYHERFLQLASHRGIKVCWLLPPITCHSPARRQQLESTYADFVRDAQRRYPNITVVDGRRSQFDRSLYVDAVHLHRQGAFALSDNLGRILAEGLPRSSWVALADSQSRPIALALEDVDQSCRLIVGRPSRQRR